MNQISRRKAMHSLAAGVAGVVTSSGISAQAQIAGGSAAAPALPAFAGKHAPKPLRFNPAKLTGLSERLILSHWENNYQGSVRALKMIESRLAGRYGRQGLSPRSPMAG